MSGVSGILEVSASCTPSNGSAEVIHPAADISELASPSPPMRTKAQLMSVKEVLVDILGRCDAESKHGEAKGHLQKIDSHLKEGQGEFPPCHWERCMSFLGEVNAKTFPKNTVDNPTTPRSKRTAVHRRQRAVGTRSHSSNFNADHLDLEAQVRCDTDKRCPVVSLRRPSPAFGQPRKRALRQSAGITICVDADESDCYAQELSHDDVTITRHRSGRGVQARCQVTQQRSKGGSPYFGRHLMQAAQRQPEWREKARNRIRRSRLSSGNENQAYHHVQQGADAITASPLSVAAVTESMPIDPSFWAPPSPPRGIIDPSQWAPPSPPKADMQIDPSCWAPPSPPSEPREPTLQGAAIDLQELTPGSSSQPVIAVSSPEHNTSPAVKDQSPTPQGLMERFCNKDLLEAQRPAGSMHRKQKVVQVCQQRIPPAPLERLPPLNKAGGNISSDLEVPAKRLRGRPPKKKSEPSRDSSPDMTLAEMLQQPAIGNAAGKAQDPSKLEIGRALRAALPSQAQRTAVGAPTTAITAPGTAKQCTETYAFAPHFKLRDGSPIGARLRFRDTSPAADSENLGRSRSPQASSSEDEAPLCDLHRPTEDEAPLADLLRSRADRAKESAKSDLWPWSGAPPVLFLDSFVSEDEDDPMTSAVTTAAAHVEGGRPKFDWQLWNQDSSAEAGNTQHGGVRVVPEFELVFCRAAFDRTSREWLASVEIPEELTSAGSPWLTGIFSSPSG